MTLPLPLIVSEASLRQTLRQILPLISLEAGVETEKAGEGVGRLSWRGLNGELRREEDNAGGLADGWGEAFGLLVVLGEGQELIVALVREDIHMKVVVIVVVGEL